MALCPERFLIAFVFTGERSMSLTIEETFDLDLTDPSSEAFTELQSIFESIVSIA